MKRKMKVGEGKCDGEDDDDVAKTWLKKVTWQMMWPN